MLPKFRRPQWRPRPPAGRAKFLALFLTFCAAIFSISLGAGPASAAGGGTAKPPKGAVSPWVIPNLADPSPFRVSTLDIRGFDVTGFIQSLAVSPNNAACPAENDPARLGGTVKINNVQYTIPCNLVIQMPANTFRWADFVNGGPSVALGGAPAPFPSFEVRLIGNIVGGTNSPTKPVPEHIAGLAYLSQQSLNTGTGTITRIDYGTGNLLVDDGTGNTAIVQINDPNGRFGRAQSPDPRLSVDDANPTIHAGTGYPMCVPRTDPAVTDDALCPQQNRPARKIVTVNGAPVPAVASCRLFSTAGIALPKSGDLTQTPAGGYCTQFVMNTVAARAVTDPDPRQQAPFEVGDFVNYSGTLMHGPGGVDFISAHTIEANMGIYTQPGSQPSYLAIGAFGVGTADLSATAVNGAAQETQNRIFLESETTDVKTPVDIYMTDVDPATGAVRNRWITPTEMTGENATPAAGPTGGITTQNTGPQPQRARIRATKAPNGLLNQPTRNVRIAVRSLCLPTPVDPTVLTINQAALDACFAAAPAVANGLQAGMYTAPTFEYIFPENVKPGDLPVPYDMWHLPALRNGEGSGTPAGVGPLTPTPW